MGGSGTATSDPDIALSCFCWAWPHPVGAEGRHGNASGRQFPSPTLTRVTASQEGDVPPARIGHAAVTLASSALAPTPSQTSSSIFVFGGEASGPNAASCSEDETAAATYPKLADVYEGCPKGSSGLLVWRALTPTRVRSPPDSTEPPESDVARDVPPPMAFHASCAASIRGSCDADSADGDGNGTEKALLVHGGRGHNSEMLADLWAFVPGRLSKFLLQGEGEGGQGDTENSKGGCGGGVRATGWQLLQPQGEG